MHFGIFMEEMRHGNSHVDAFQEAFQLAEAAETWGLDGVWLVGYAPFLDTHLGGR